MNRAPASQRQRQTQYLIIYNVVCVTLWVAVLGRVLLLVPLVGFENVYGGVGNFVKWTQTLAVLEVVHSALGVYSSRHALNRDIQTATTNRALSIVGLVRSPLSTTLMQVSSRLALVWAVVNAYPADTAPSPFYTTMILAWSITEVVRYNYFVLNLRGYVPSFMTWLRYNTFYVLYPVGILSEMSMVLKAIGPAGREWGAGGQWALWGALAAYVPGM